MDITNQDDLIDLRDVLTRVEELQRMLTGLTDELVDEYDALTAILAACKGCGGDEQYEGDWYPVTLVRDSYFEAYAQQLAEDIGAVGEEVHWPYTCIDWEWAARELRMDYTSVEFDGVTYWCR